MVSLRVSKNGRVLCTAGAEDLGVLMAIVQVLGDTNTESRLNSGTSMNLQVSGGRSHPEREVQHVEWIRRLDLSIGDRVEIEIVDAPDPGSPE